MSGTNEFTRCWRCRAICPADAEGGLCDNCRGDDIDCYEGGPIRARVEAVGEKQGELLSEGV